MYTLLFFEFRRWNGTDSNSLWVVSIDIDAECYELNQKVKLHCQVLSLFAQIEKDINQSYAGQPLCQITCA